MSRRADRSSGRSCTRAARTPGTCCRRSTAGCKSRRPRRTRRTRPRSTGRLPDRPASRIRKGNSCRRIPPRFRPRRCRTPAAGTCSRLGRGQSTRRNRFHRTARCSDSPGCPRTRAAGTTRGFRTPASRADGSRQCCADDRLVHAIKSTFSGIGARHPPGAGVTAPGGNSSAAARRARRRIRSRRRRRPAPRRTTVDPCRA